MEKLVGEFMVKFNEKFMEEFMKEIGEISMDESFRKQLNRASLLSRKTERACIIEQSIVFASCFFTRFVFVIAQDFLTAICRNPDLRVNRNTLQSHYRSCQAW